MMSIGVGDIAVIALTSLAAALVVVLLSALLLRVIPRPTMLIRLIIVAGSGVVTVAIAVLAIAFQMYISPHDFTVLVWVVGISLLFGLAVATVASRAARASLADLTRSVHEVGDGEVVPASGRGWSEFDALSTELAEVSERLASARAELEQLDSDRRRFFAWISHDLRTPLTAVHALAESLELGVAADSVQVARQVRGQAHTMSRMVDDLFELSKITSGAVRLKTEQVDLLDVVSDAVADVRPMAERRSLQIAQAGIAGHVLWVDPHKLHRIVVNLLGNAIRHAPEGSEVLISATELPGRRLVLGVLDHGSGVATSDLDRMFEVGWRADAARATDPEDPLAAGAGLGLAIARGFARAHGGEVYAEHADEGFRINVLLPVGQGND
ncbi:HAMP domain-containing sensor histidine kinase [Microbacterium shaanxiense]